MADIDMAALAREREARRGVPKDTAPLPKSWASRPTPAAPPAGNLFSAHRSIRLARAVGLAAIILVALFFVLGWMGLRTAIIGLLLAVGLARGGGRLMHGILPPMLIEAGAKPPSDAEVASTAAAGLFCLEGAKNLGVSLGAEYALALDSLAFVCTYGRKNCLTDNMYSGELSLGKIVGLVWGKLREGVIRC